MIRIAGDIPPQSSWREWIRSKADERAVAEGCWFDIRAANRVKEFFEELLCHSSGEWAGKPFVLIDWQWREVIAPLYGWRRADGTRRFRRGYIEIPKKNGKSTLCSGLSLYHLVADGEQGAQVFCAAADRIQAGIVYDEAAHMVEASPELAAHLELIRSQKRIVYQEAASVFRALAADAGRNEGLKTSFLIFDELHAQKSRALWDSLRWGGASREQPLMLAITTAGWDRTSICYEQYLYGKGVLAGHIEDSSYFAYIAEAEESDDWNDEKTWFKANPSLGHTIKLESFRDDYREAKQSTASENAFRRYRLNQWTEQDVRWLNMDKWAECADEYDEASLEGMPCYAGLDLATTMDVSAFVLVFRMDDGSYRILPYFWAPAEANKMRERMNKSRVDHWMREGYIKTSPGDQIDYGMVRNDIMELSRRFDIRKIAKDRWNSAQIGQELSAEGFEILDMGQGIASMSAPAKEFERLIHAGLLRHNNNPVLNWMAGNVSVEVDGGGNIKPSKKKSSDKIDGVVSAIMGVALQMQEPAESGIQEIKWA